MTKEDQLQKVGSDIRRIALEWEGKLSGLQEEQITQRLNRQGRNIKQLVGHMIDLASNNHQWMVRLQYINNLQLPDFRHHSDLWISIQQYQQEDWKEMLELWKSYNFHIAHLIKYVDPSCLNNCWTDGEKEPLRLLDLIYDYLAHLRYSINEINLLLKA